MKDFILNLPNTPSFQEVQGADLVPTFFVSIRAIEFDHAINFFGDERDHYAPLSRQTLTFSFTSLNSLDEEFSLEERVISAIVGNTPISGSAKLAGKVVLSIKFEKSSHISWGKGKVRKNKLPNQKLVVVFSEDSRAMGSRAT